MVDLDRLERLLAEATERPLWVLARGSTREATAASALESAAPYLIASTRRWEAVRGEPYVELWEAAEHGLAAAARERDRLRRHYDAAGPEHNLLALLDLYDERRRTAAREVDRLRAENARLQAALRKAASAMESECDGWGAEALAALRAAGGEP